MLHIMEAASCTNETCIFYYNPASDYRRASLSLKEMVLCSVAFLETVSMYEASKSP